jgi:PAS domain S-box-containing protein
VHLICSHDYTLVALSVLIAMFTSYAALDLAGRVTAASGWIRVVWLLGGAGAMGTGIWSMHYIGMLACILPHPVAYHWPTVLLSLFAAILASVIALYVVSRQKMSAFRAFAGSVLMGGGIASMHYIGMAAMRMSAISHYDALLVLLSVVFAVLISLAALWITFHFRDEKAAIGWRKIAGAVVMGAAIPIMHYTGMAAADFTPSGMPADLSRAISISTLGAAGIAAATFIVLGLALLTSWVDKRFAAKTLELQEEKLQRSEAYLAEAQRLSHAGSFGWRVSTGEIIWSEETYRIFQYDRTTTPTVERVLQRVHPEDAAQVKQTIERASQDGKDFEHEYRLVMPDSSVKYVHVVAHALRDESRSVEFVGAVMDVTERKRAEMLLTGEKRLLEMIARGDSRAFNLEAFCRLFEELSSGSLSSILLLDPSANRLRHGAAPSLPINYTEAIDGLVIGPSVGSCGTAAYRAEPVIVSDIATDRLWADYRDLALAHGLRACWSSPILSSNGRVLGTFATYYREPRSPTPQEHDVIEQITHLASIAVERKQSEDALREQAALLNLTRDTIFVRDVNDVIKFWNRGAEELYGWKKEEAIGRVSHDLIQTIFPAPLESITAELNRAGRWEGEIIHTRRDGTKVVVASRWSLQRDDQGRPAATLETNNDITARKQVEVEKQRLEAQLRQSQKMEAMGTLAGGIAHDFNNILGAILGYGELAQKDVAEGSVTRRHLDQVMHAGGRAKALVERILAFSRSGLGERVPVHVQSVVEETLDMLAASLPAVVRLEKALDAGNAAVVGDTTQLHQVVMNLCTNAAHAMEHGGVLTVAVDHIEMPERRLLSHGMLSQCPYIRLVVSDTGLGIPPTVLERMFDPFFTTKGVGEGTGLGLSLVHAIVADLGGAIDIASKVGEGTIFAIWLPVAGQVVRPVAEAVRDLPRGNGEAVMIVDDERSLVMVAEETLAALGYEPAGFDSSVAALQAFSADPRRFDLVLTDETMPDLSGTELAREIRRLRSDIPIVLMSGYSDARVTERAHAAGVSEVLRKPLVSRDIAEPLARALAARR